MTSPDLSTIAQLLFADDTTLDFARIVSELDTVLSRLCGQSVEITWDCDDLVTFDTASTRIVLGWSETRIHRLNGCLTVSVGPGPVSQTADGLRDHDVLCSRLIDRIQTRFDPEAVLWCQVEGVVDAEVVDELIAELPEFASTLPPVDSILDHLSRADLQRSGQPPQPRQHQKTRLLDGPPKIPARMPVLVAANDQPDLPRPCNAELTSVRAALYPDQNPAKVDAPYSTQMRLAAHCLNATLILVWAPLGAAVMTYSVLRGENMALSARMMAVTGTLFALAHSPVGQTMSAMAKSIG